jgi:hypothetical protein
VAAWLLQRCNRVRHFLLYDGNSMTTPYSTQIEHPQGMSSNSIDEMRQMFATRKLSGLEGFLER